VLRSTTNLYKATAHTCILRRAMNLIIPKITKASYQNMRNAYKNKYTSKCFQFSHTWPLVQNEARYAFTKKIRHISRINISDTYKSWLINQK
jgi:hypothetical protein